MARLPIALFIASGLGHAACADDATPAGTTDASDEVADTSRPDAPTPWIYPADQDVVSPTLQPAALQSAVEVAMAAALELEPQVVLELHRLLYPTPVTGSGDPSGCPFFLTYDYGTAKAFYWQGECTAGDGTMYSGYGYASWYDDFAVDFGTLDGFEYYLACLLYTSDAADE